MRLFIDAKSASRFRLTSRNSDHGGTRRYYLHGGNRRAIIVCRNGVALEQFTNERVDAQVGWDSGTRGFVRDADVGQQHTKITIYRRIEGYAPKSLGDVLDEAPRREEDIVMRMLVVSCSKTKDDHPIPMPAIERYDGPAFRVIRKAMREGYWPDDVQLLIVSAEFGLLTTDAPIPWYDTEMTPARAMALQDDIARVLDEHLAGADEVFLNVAGAYHTALAGSKVLADLRDAGCVQEAAGRIGERLAQMKQWIQQSHEEEIE